MFCLFVSLPGALACGRLVLPTDLLMIRYLPLLVGIGLDDGPDLCIGRLVTRMRLILVIAIPLKQVGVRCAFDTVAAETVNDPHMRASFSDC